MPFQKIILSLCYEDCEPTYKSSFIALDFIACFWPRCRLQQILAHRPLARADAIAVEANPLNFMLLCYSRFALRQQRSEPSPLRLQSSLRPSQPHPTRYGARLMRGCVGSQFSTLGGSGQRILVKIADQNTAQNDF